MAQQISCDYAHFEAGQAGGPHGIHANLAPLPGGGANRLNFPAAPEDGAAVKVVAPIGLESVHKGAGVAGGPVSSEPNDAWAG